MCRQTSAPDRHASTESDDVYLRMGRGPLWALVIPSQTGAWWGKTLRGLLERPADPGRCHLRRGHRALGKRRWGDPLQSHADTSTGDDVSLTRVAPDKDQWGALDTHVVAKMLRRSPKSQLPKTRWMICEDADAM